MNDYKTKTKEHDFLTMQDLFLDAKLSSEITSLYWQECYQVPADNNSLFQGKNRYWLNHNSRGRDYALVALSARKRRRLCRKNLHLAAGMCFTETNGFPQLEPYTPGDFNITLYDYTHRHKHNEGEPWAVHFFAPDETFDNAITGRLEQTTAELAECDMVFAPDSTLYVDAPEFINKQSIFESRFAAAYWQQCGFNVIQTASWGSAESFKYCFEGLAEHSATAVSGIGHGRSRAATELWQCGLRRLVEEKQPSVLIVFGGDRDTIPCDLGVPIIYCEDYITKHFRKPKTNSKSINSKS